MNCSGESNSDTDSNLSTSWVYVDDEKAKNNLAQNKYYLKCSTEHLEELSETLLNSNTSDEDPESDGISVISESEELKEKLSQEDSTEFISDTDVSLIENVGNNVEDLHEGNRINSPNYIVAFGILILGFLIGLYFSDSDQPTSCNVQNESQGLNTYFNSIDVSYEEVNDTVEDKKIASDYNVSQDKTQTSYIMDLEKIIIAENAMPRKKRRTEKDFGVKDKNVKLKETKVKFEKTPKKLEKNPYNLKKEKNKNIKSEKRSKRTNLNDNEREQINLMKEEKSILQRKKQLKKLEKRLKKREVSLKQKERALKQLKGEILEQYQNMLNEKQKNGDKLKISGKKNWNTEKQNRTKLVSGEWYWDLFLERNKLRKQGHKANWVFNRAELRRQRRDKAQWYFNWMTDREDLRFKHKFKSYSY